MYLMYVDESGDAGLVGSPTTHFALSGLVIHESDWRTFIGQMKAFRATIKGAYGLPMRAEIHASEYIRRPPVPGMARFKRLAILRHLLDELAKMPFISVTNVIVAKSGKAPPYDVFEIAWRTLFQRFENTMGYGNFPGRHRADYGIVLTDATNGTKLTRIMRRMNVYNPVPNLRGPGIRNLPVVKVIEDPHPKNSADSYFVQACDVCAYFLAQHAKPNGYIRRMGAANYLNRLRPVLNQWASRTDPLGIVRL
jgi:hypothetical protein